MEGGRIAIVLPHQLAIVRAEMEATLEDDEFGEGQGWVTYSARDMMPLGITPSVFWDALSYLDQEGECWMDEDMVEFHDEDAPTAYFSIWIAEE